jgi:hypothetical protein
MKKKMKNLYLKEEFSREILKGGLSDELTILDLAQKHKGTLNFDLSSLVDYLTRQLVDGVFVEMEHTDSPQKAREIAMDHLFEDPSYYVKLKKIER